MTPAASDLHCPCGAKRSFLACCAEQPERRKFDDEQLEAWARELGIAEQLHVTLRSLPGARQVESLPSNYRNRLGVAELLAPAYRYALTEAALRPLRAAAWSFLAAERQSVLEGVAAEARLPPAPPARSPTLALLASRLEALRLGARQSAWPRSLERLPGAALRVHAATRQLSYRERVRVFSLSSAASVEPSLTLDLARCREQPLEPPPCACGAELPCTHLLAAIDLALRALADPGRDAAWDALARELETPDWSRALAVFDAARAARAQAASPARRIQLSFELEVADHGARIAVNARLHRRRRDGSLDKGRRVSPRDFAGGTDALAPDERRAAEALGLAPRRGNPYTSYGWAPSPADVATLVGHPRVFLSGEPDRPLEVCTATLSLRVNPLPEGGLAVVPAAAGLELPLQDLLRVFAEGRGDGGLLHLDRERRRCLVVTAHDRETTQRALTALALHGNRFPAEAESALLERLGSLQEALPVELAPGLAGEEVPAERRMVVRLELRETGLALRVLAAPLAGAPPQPPGEGPPRLLSSLGGLRRSTHRDLEGERAAATAILAALELSSPGAPEGFQRTVSDDAAALALLERLRGLPAEVAVEWIGPPVRTVRASSAAELRVVVRDQRDWFGLEGEVEVDGQQVKLALLLEALRERRSVIRLRGGAWLALSGALAERLAPLALAATAGARGTEIGPAALSLLDDLERDGARLDAQGAFGQLRERMRTASRARAPIPRAFRGKLRDYQRDGFRWLARLSAWGAGALLADDMGLGKTLQALALLCHRAGDGPALVVAPTSVCANWAAEARRFAPSLRVSLFRDSDRAEAVAALGPGDVLVASYGLLALDLPRFAGKRFATLVLDEAQAVKNAATRRARAARELEADFRLLLSGTPVENHLGELWSLFRVAFPGLLGSWERYRETFALPIERDRDPVRQRALAATLRPFLLRRTKDEVARELPARTEIPLPVALSEPERRLYEQARLAAVARLAGVDGEAGEQGRFQILAAITGLRLLACHPRLHDPVSPLASAKLARFLALAAELREGGHRALVFSQFTSHLALVREALDAAGARYLYLDGKTPAAERDRLVARFQAGEGELFLISLKAGGTGLNLTGADYVVHLDPWWNPAVEDQATDRAHRIGQQKPVTVYRLLSQGTIEEAIVKLHARKRELVDGVLDGMDAAGRLSPAELMALIRAGPDASPGASVEPEAAATALEAEESPASGPDEEVAVTAAPATGTVRSTGGAASAPGSRPRAPAYQQLFARFAAHLEACHSRGELHSAGTVKTYARAASRFLEFLHREGLPAPLREGEVRELAGRYQEALANGSFPAPPSEPLVARGALPRLARFLGAG